MTPVDQKVKAPATSQQWSTLISSAIQPEPEPKVRRCSRRNPVQGEIKAVNLADAGAPMQLWELWQVSPEGLTARAPREVPVDVRFALDVEINGETLCLRGRTMHCTQTIGGYKVGVRLIFDE